MDNNYYYNIFIFLTKKIDKKVLICTLDIAEMVSTNFSRQEINLSMSNSCMSSQKNSVILCLRVSILAIIVDISALVTCYITYRKTISTKHCNWYTN